MELIGRQFGHIRVTEVVGEGGMGAVYAGYDEKLDRKVALKVLHAEQRLDDEARERLLREARALSKVDHPNICRIHDYIETGDVDLLVLEYIDGRTLQAAIEDGLPHSEKLRIAIAVAEVLVRAHRAGIVHRDLKPENVMLTRGGEVKVLDFGLARWLQRGRRSGSHPSYPGEPLGAEEPQAPQQPILHVRSDADAPVVNLGDTMILPAVRPSAAFASGRREFLATAVGITLGTPFYMSPEQARGETLTPASDMFSFGLLLQVLFTGREPHPDFITAREVILRVARGETNPVEGARKDVAALINSLKQYAPADRPTAVQTVERLRFLIETPQRVARRAIAGVILVIMLAGVWRYTVDLRFEQSRAVAAQVEAERQRAKAEDMVEFMLGDLRKKLEPVGKLDILDDVAGRALTYVDEIDPDVSGASELARNSKALNQLVEVRIAQGNLQDALNLANRSMRLTYLASQKAPNDPEVQLAYGLSNFWVGNVNRLRGDMDIALERMKTYSRVTAELARKHPANETYLLERAYGHSNVATILEMQGDLATALPQHELTLDVKTARVKASPADPERQADLAVTLNKIGVVHLHLGHLDRAIEYLDREVAVYERLTAADPLNRQWKDQMARSLGWAAAAHTYAGHTNRAFEYATKALKIETALLAFDPANARWKRNLAMSNRQLGLLLSWRGAHADVEPYFERATTLMEELIALHPTSTAYPRDLAIVLAARGRAAFDRGDHAAARNAATRAAAYVGQPANEGSRQTMAEVHLLAGDVAQAAGRRDHAVEEWTAAAALCVQMASSSNPAIRHLHVSALLRLGHQKEAAPMMAALDQAGYRAPAYLADRDRWLAARPAPTMITSGRGES